MAHASEPRHPSAQEQTELVEMLHERLMPEVAELAEHYDLTVCTTIRLMAKALHAIHTSVHLPEVLNDPRWS